MRPRAKARPPPRPLHGVPLAHKDMFYREGRISTGGSRILRDQVATTTATVLRRLDAAGAIEIGVLNMAEFAAGPTGHNIHFGHCRNAFNAAHIAGGSSSGSAVAVAARAIFGALGSDTGASIRLPAAYNGVDRIEADIRARQPPRRDAAFVEHGPCRAARAQSARDCALLLQIIAGDDPNDATASARPVPGLCWALSAPSAFPASPSGSRITASRSSPEIGAAMDESVRVLERIGAKVVRVALPDLAPLFRVGEAIIKGEAAAMHRQWLESGRRTIPTACVFASKAGFICPRRTTSTRCACAGS